MWGMGIIQVFNIEAGNYYSKSTFIMTLIKQEKRVFILVILYRFGSIYMYVFYKIVYVYPKFSYYKYLVPDITENSQP